MVVIQQPQVVCVGIQI